VSNHVKQSSAGEILETLGIDQPTATRPLWKKWVFWISLFCLAALGTGYWSNQNAPPVVQYQTEHSTRGDLAITVTATGNLEPTNQVEVGSELSGIIESVAVDYNDQIKVGQVLAKLDVAKMNTQILQSEASLESAQAKVLQALATVKVSNSDLARLRRVRELSGGKVPSQQDLDSAEADLARAAAEEASARAEVAQAQASLAENRTDLAKATIVSPINGIVLERSVEPGQTVAASLQAVVLFTLAEDLSRMELQVDVDEADVGQVKAGLEATFTVDAYPNRSFPASIVQVRYGADTEDGVVTYKTVLNVDNSDLALRPGMTATADIIVERRENVLLIPNAALRFTPTAPDQKNASTNNSLLSRIMLHPPPPAEKKQTQVEAAPGRQQLWILRNGQPASIDVSTGITNGLHTEIVDGSLESGMVVITGTVEENL
jgi:HlyD family secretion protein